MKIWQFVSASCLLILSSWALADVYKWVDEKGVTHYGNQKPPEAKAEQVKVSGGGVSSDENPDPMDQLDPEAREMAEAMKKELLKDHGNGALNCAAAISNAIGQMDNHLSQAKRNLDGGYITQDQYSQVNSEFNLLKSRISVSACDASSGAKREFYQCMSNSMNSVIMCVNKYEAILK